MRPDLLLTLKLTPLCRPSFPTYHKVSLGNTTFSMEPDNSTIFLHHIHIAEWEKHDSVAETVSFSTFIFTIHPTYYDQISQSLANYFTAYSQFLPSSDSFRTAKSSLPPLYSGITEYTTQNKAISHPTLFEAYASIYVYHSTLQLRHFQYHAINPLKDFPMAPADNYSNKISVILDHLQCTTQPMTPNVIINGTELCRGLRDRLTTTIINWVEDCISKLSSSDSLQAIDPTPDRILQLIRSVAFVYAVNPAACSHQNHKLYRKLLSVLCMRTLRNYAAVLHTLLINLEPLANLGTKEYSLFKETLISMMGAWVECFPILAEEMNKSGEFAFSGVFPGITPSTEEADALEWVLGQKSWWCISAFDFPLHISACHFRPLIKVLARIPLEEAWLSWSLFDKFCCVIVLLATSIPFLNRNMFWFNKQEIDEMEFLGFFASGVEEHIRINAGANTKLPMHLCLSIALPELAEAGRLGVVENYYDDFFSEREVEDDYSGDSE